MSPEPDTSNLASPKGDTTMTDADTDDTATAASHNHDGTTSVPKDAEAAEAARVKGAEDPTAHDPRDTSTGSTSRTTGDNG